MTLRAALIVLNILAATAVAVVGSAMIISRRAKERMPLNLAAPQNDELLETRKLERVLGTALILSVVIASGLVMYWIFEPNRQADATAGFDKRAVERGAILFATKGMKEYDATRSLLCASCHGADAGGGSTPFVIASADASCKAGDTRGICLPRRVSWKAPALDTVFFRFPRRKADCTGLEKIDPTNSDCATEISHIIAFGRPGTPMPAWGVSSGKGVLNEQGISDLVAYLDSIQLSPEKAKAQVAKDVTTLRNDAKTALKTAQENLAAASAELAKTTSDVDDVRTQAKIDAATFADRVAAQAKVDAAQLALANSQAYATKISRASEGELLFLTNCARCHTKGWSFNDPANPGTPLPGTDGSGAFGPNLTDIGRQFPNPATHAQFISNGSQADQQFGLRGVGTGRMPGFGLLLTPDQIQAIVNYERSL